MSGDIRNLGVNRVVHKLEDHEQPIVHVMIRIPIIVENRSKRKEKLA